MHSTGTRYVAKSPGGSGALPVSNSSRVNHSTLPGGCGSIIPKFEVASEEGTKGNFRKDPIWCGMKSESLPGHYFICSECLGRIDRE